MEPMEQWEKELREKLEKELPEGGYEIGGPGLVARTGKQGKINYEVLLQKTVNEFIVTDAVKGDSASTLLYHKAFFDLETFTKEIYDFYKANGDVNFEVIDPPAHPADISKSVNEWHKQVLSVDEIIERYSLTEEEAQKLRNMQKLKQ